MAPLDEKFMTMALDLARRGYPMTSPNPMVGAILVKGHRIVGKGYHQQFGGPHAEINALKKAGSKAHGATLYVTLEPCSHQGKTPPCLDAVLQSKIAKVVIASKDPNPLVSGRSIRTLRRRGVAVSVGTLDAENKILNKVFFKWKQKGLPYVVYKTAMTLDGKIASGSGESKWITGAKARREVARIRSGLDGVLVGTQTVLKDNPRLTARNEPRNPIRIAFDRDFKIPLRHRFFQGKESKILITATAPNPLQAKALFRKKARALVLPAVQRRFSALKALKALARLDVSSLLIEGGGETAWNFVRSGLIDEYLFFVAPRVLGGRHAKTPVMGEGYSRPRQAASLKVESVSQLGNDILIRATPKK